ncbi:hypothetical protein CARUB_v10025892mg, partial [Capsella rubella]
MERSLRLLLVIIAKLAIIHLVQAQNQQGFISLDCGLPAEFPPYNDQKYGIQYSSDAAFIQSGKIGQIQADLEKTYRKQATTLRYFPDGIRNCYNLNAEKGRSHLIRARFVYGNYDGRNTIPKFDLYLGPNLWASIDLNGNRSREEIVHIPTSNSLKICLVKTGKTTPIISTLEIRPLGPETYITEPDSSHLRYPDDAYDRRWRPHFQSEWTQVSTTSNVDNSNGYDPPKAALLSAAIPTNASEPLTITWEDTYNDQYYVYTHLSEIQELQANENREFIELWNGEITSSKPEVPPKLEIYTTYPESPMTCEEQICSFQLIRTSQSTLPPLLNAIEVYTVVNFTHSETIENDVMAINSIKDAYGLNRINWQGDPCVPHHLIWDGLSCSYTNISTPPRITSLNLSSTGLTGTIAAAIQNLTQLEKLDLSNNNLSGGVPEFLGNIESLTVINLRGNNLYGSIPQSLQKKGLELSVEGNPRLCVSDSCKKKFPLAIVASVAVAIIGIAILVLFLVLRKKNRRFTYSEVIKMTNNFQRVLGKGGFGMVYHGSVNGSEQVAVKLLSQSSTQGYKEFKAEVDLLLRVHHTNLLSLVGYCYEGDNLALIYEFLPNGDLKQHLSGKGGGSIISWSTRLRVALEAAQGLEYLHIGCKPPMVHRDVKTANILLDESFKAKLSDFGLSRSFQCGGGEYQDATAIAGTLGYLDPEYNHSGRLDEKSDVYSFGIVLLEMITNQPVINQTPEKSHITQWVGFQINGGDILQIMDPNLGKDYDINSAWRALELAMSCVNPSSSKRPSMSQVISELKECIVCENSGISANRGLESQEMDVGLETT